MGELISPEGFGGIAPADLLRPDADVKPILTALNANDSETVTIRTPLRVEQGAKDAIVFPFFTDQLVAGLRKRGTRVTFAKRAGVDHGGIVRAGAAGSTAWIANRLKG